MYYVYIIQSKVDGSYYKGYSENPLQRLEQHNNKESKYTSRKIPWQLVHIETYLTKKEALIRERVLKKYSHEQIRSLAATTKNILEDYIKES